MSGRRPEHKAPPEIYYNEAEAERYSSNARILNIQGEMSERALELLCLDPDASCLLLDIGCGSGLSGTVIEEAGHTWVGVDISQAMLDVAVKRKEGGDFMLGDMGQGLPFRAGVFDGAISISAIQWLCNADKKEHSPPKRLLKFFETLYSCLGRAGRAVFQFYPENSEQIELITSQATRAGFNGGLVVDYPHSTKAKKFYLVLMMGEKTPLPQALGTDGRDATVAYSDKRMTGSHKNRKPLKKSREWVLEKKERRRRQGKTVRDDTKYSGRVRSGRF